MAMESKIDDPSVRFPTEIRVLAVHDNPILLRILETLLRKCRYDVTTAGNAAVAINLLRENSSKFDLVISDVYMDGFQLLGLVGLEMDLPVVMLSADDDPNTVLKGINNHGACGYLLKPVTLEEIEDIRQHVYQRKKLVLDDPKQKRSPSGRIAKESKETVLKKRKDENEKAKDNMQQLDEDNPPVAKKKNARLNWSPELHRKFIDAINHLGIEKAMPKKILELMTEENLTRQQVANRLQKYRQSLKRDSGMANEQARDALLGFQSPILSYAPKSLLDGSGRFAEESEGAVLKKRKDENEKAEDYLQQQDEVGFPAAKKKKAWLNWSPDLHLKFIEAVNHLGMEKAVPTKILELMKDENLTSKQVASHLQKYRQSSKRVNKIANEQARAAPFGFPSPIPSSAPESLVNGSDTVNPCHSFPGLAPLGAPRPFPTNPILTPPNNNTTINLSHNVDVPTNLSDPFYGLCDLETSTGGSCSMPCVSRNQAWPCDKPLRGVSNDICPSSSSEEDCSSLGIVFDFHEDSIDKILQEILNFLEQPNDGEDLLVLPAIDSGFHGSGNESNIKKTEEEEEWMSRRCC